MEEQELTKARTAIVAKSNDLIQKSRFSLTAQQQKIVLFLISKITPQDTEFKRYKFSIKEFCEVCGLDSSNGKYYLELRRAIKELRDKSLWIKLSDGKETLISWIEKAYIEQNNGVIEIRFDEDLKPYLLQLKKNYTQFELIYTLQFKSKYTIRLYELIQSIHYETLKKYSRIFDVEKLKTLLDAGKYEEYRDFKRRVLTPAKDEINKYSDKIIDYKEIKSGRRIEKIEITIEPKPIEETIAIQAKIEKEFNKNTDDENTQLVMFDREEIGQEYWLGV